MSERLLDSPTITEPTTEPQKVDKTPSFVAEARKNGAIDWDSLTPLIEADIKSVEAHLGRMNGNGHKKPEAKKAEADKPLSEPMDTGIIYTVEAPLYEPGEVEQTSNEVFWAIKADITPVQYQQAKKEYMAIPQDHESLYTGWDFHKYLVYYVTRVANERRGSVRNPDEAHLKGEAYAQYFDKNRSIPDNEREKYDELAVYRDRNITFDGA